MAGAAALALWPAAASAQMPMPGIHLGGDKDPPSAQEQARRRAVDNAYNSANQKIPAKKPAADPWGNIRSAPGSANAQDKGKQ